MQGKRIGRRVFLGTAGMAALGAGTAQGEPPVMRKIRSLVVEGIADIDLVVARQPIVLPPDLVGALQAGATVRYRAEYPFRDDLMAFYVFLAGPADPAPPLTSLSPSDPRIFANLIFEVYDTLVSMYPEPNFGLLARTIAEPKVSPFFPGVTGRVTLIEAGFENEGETNFKLFGVGCAGDHAVYARQARGRIELQP